jgi:hypothetical protein
MQLKVFLEKKIFLKREAAMVTVAVTGSVHFGSVAKKGCKETFPFDHQSLNWWLENLQCLVQLDLRYPVARPCIIIANNRRRKHLQQCEYRTLPAPGNRVARIIRAARYQMCKSNGKPFVCF